jgi:hypothetical protein
MNEKRLQVHLDAESALALAAIIKRTRLTEADAVRAAIRLAEEVGVEDDARFLVPLASTDWPWPEWWGVLCEELERRKQVGQVVATRSGVKNKIVAVDPQGGVIELLSERSRSGKARQITVGMLKNRKATAHGVIVRALRDLADSLPQEIPREGWHGPFKVLDLLQAAIEAHHDWPPERLGVYLVTRHHWKGTPSAKAEPLYVGSTTGRSARFATRVGDLIIDMFGFFGTATGHSSGGQSLWKWSAQNGTQPGELYLAWFTACDMCPRCEEVRWWKKLNPSLNRKAPPKCTQH